MRIDLVGDEVEILKVGEAIELCFSNSNDLVLYADSFVTLPNGRVAVVDGRTEDALRPVLYLLNRIVASAEVTPVGILEMAFDDGVRLRVFPDPDAVAWTLVAHGGGRITSLPGGQIELETP